MNDPLTPIPRRRFDPSRWDGTLSRPRLTQILRPAGLDLPRRGANVVVDDLHFTRSLYMSQTLEARGLQLRELERWDGRIPLDAVDRAIDGGTRLVAALS